MKYHEHCEKCGHTLTAYTHKMNKMLAQALLQIVEFYEKESIPCNLQKHLKLTKNQYNNFQKLQYFGLVHRDEKGWVPTQKGTDFIYGLVMIQSPVATLGKKILNQTHRAWQTHSEKPQIINIASLDATVWKQKEMYREERRETLFD